MNIFETIYKTVLLAVLSAMFMMSVIIYDDDRGAFKIGDYGKKMKAIIIYKWVLSLFFAGVNLISIFVSFQDLVSRTLTIAFNLYSFGILLYDILHKQVKSEEYIINLQNELLKDIDMSEVFEARDSMAKYDYSGNDSTMLFKVIQGENGWSLVKQCQDGRNQMLVPKIELEEEEAKFLCQQINIYWTNHQNLPNTIKVFVNKKLYNHRKEFLWFPSPKPKFIYSDSYRKKYIKAIKISGYVILVICAILFILDYYKIIAFDNIFWWLY